MNTKYVSHLKDCSVYTTLDLATKLA